MTGLEAIEQQIDGLIRASYRVREKQRNLCVDCEACEESPEPHEYWGGMVYKTECECPIDFEVGASGCHRGDEYEELQGELENILREIGELRELPVEVFESEVA